MLVSLAASAQLVAAGDLRGTFRVEGKPQRNVVIWIDSLGSPKGVVEKEPVIDQRNLTFSPLVLAVQVGTTVRFPNNDRVLHNVFSFRDGKQFDLGLYPIGTSQKVKFTRPGLSRLFCNIHSGMAAYVMAVDSAYFGVSDANGVFTISDLAPGTYAFHAWWPGAEVRAGSLVFEPGKEVDLEWH